MAINRSTQYFTLAGLTVFKEKVLKNYFKLNEKDAYINGVIYNAMMQHKRDIVKFCASQRALPPVGNPGTLYMVPSHVDNPQYKPASNEIWVTSTNGFDTMRFKPGNTSEYIDMPKNEYGFFVLDLNKVPKWTGYNCYFGESEETSAGITSTNINRGSTALLYQPTITGTTTSTSSITSFAQLYKLSGKIIAVNEGESYVNALPLPQLYTGNGTDVRISRNLSEIWISAPYNGEYVKCIFGNGYRVNAYKNSQGFYVLNLGDIVRHKVIKFEVRKPGGSEGYSMFTPGTTTTFGNYSQLVALAGKILAVTTSYDSGNYSRETTILPQYTYTGTLPAQYTVPDDEIWVLSDDTTLRVRYGSYDNTLDTKNEYGYFVIKKGVHLPTSGNYNLYLGNTTNYVYACEIEYGGAVLVDLIDELNKLYGHIWTKNGNANAQTLFAITPYDNSEVDIVTNAVSGITIPNNEVWIDSANWPTLQIVVYNSSTSKYVPIEVTKNEYGYYVLHTSDLSEYSSNNYNLYCCTKDIDLKDFSNSNYTKYRSGNLYFYRGISNATVLYSSNIFTYLGSRRIVVCTLNPYIDVIPDTLPIVAYTSANSDRFVTYAYENGKYVTLGNTVFSEKEYPIDRSLDANSLHTVYNSTIYNALQGKYNTADILDEVDENDTRNIVTSRAIQAELAKKLGWEELHNITLYQLMRELRFPWNMPTEMYFKLVVYAPLKEQDLAIYYPTLTQRLQLTVLGTNAFVPTNKFPYITYNSSDNTVTRRDVETDRIITLKCYFDIAMYSSTFYYLAGSTSSAQQTGNTGADVQFTIYSKNPISMTTLGQLSYKFKAYGSSESSNHSHINKIYVSTYISPDGVDWHQLQNKTIYNWDDNYEDLNDYIYIIPLLA